MYIYSMWFCLRIASTIPATGSSSCFLEHCHKLFSFSPFPNSYCKGWVLDYTWGFPKMGVLLNSWMVYSWIIHLQMDDLGVPLILETSRWNQVLRRSIFLTELPSHRWWLTRCMCKQGILTYMTSYPSYCYIQIIYILDHIQLEYS